MSKNTKWDNDGYWAVVVGPYTSREKARKELDWVAKATESDVSTVVGAWAATAAREGGDDSFDTAAAVASVLAQLGE